ncbi:MAG TPA: ATP synthase F1 subunit epsilon [Candidatus Paceibacterota bacterium]
MINLKVITPHGLIWDGEVASVNLKTTSGEITVLPNHIPLVSTLEKGMVKIVSEGKKLRAEIAGGVLEVKRGSHIVIITTEASKFLEEDKLE